MVFKPGQKISITEDLKIWEKNQLIDNKQTPNSSMHACMSRGKSKLE